MNWIKSSKTQLINIESSKWKKFFYLRSTKMGSILRLLLLPFAYLSVFSIFYAIFVITKENYLIKINYSFVPEWIKVLETLSKFLLELFPLTITISIAMYYSKKFVLATFSSIIIWVVFCFSQTLFIHKTSTDGIYQVLWYKNINSSYINNFLGISEIKGFSFNFIDAILTGYLIGFCLNKTEKHKTFKYINFNRVVMYFAPMLVFVLIFIHLLFMGFFATSLSSLKNNRFSTKTSASFVVGLLEQILIPFGMNKSLVSDFTTVNFDLNQQVWVIINNQPQQVIDSSTKNIETYKTLLNSNLDFATTKEQLFNMLNSNLNKKELITTLDNSFLFNINQFNHNSSAWWKNQSNSVYFIDPSTQQAFNLMFGKFNVATLLNSLFVIPFLGIVMILLTDKDQIIFTTQVVIASVLGSFFIGTEYTITLIVLMSSPLMYIAIFYLISPIMQLIIARIGLSAETSNYGFFEYINIAARTQNQTGIAFIFIFALLIGLLIAIGFYFFALKTKPFTPGMGNCKSMDVSIIFESRNSKQKQPINLEDSIPTQEFWINNTSNTKKDTQKYNLEKSNYSETQVMTGVYDIENKEVIELNFDNKERKTEFFISSPVAGKVAQLNANTWEFSLSKFGNKINSQISGMVESFNNVTNEITIKNDNFTIKMQILFKGDLNKYTIFKQIPNSFVHQGNKLLEFSFEKNIFARKSLRILLSIESKNNQKIISHHSKKFSDVNQDTLLFSVEEFS
ncbi:hypothetical protein [Mycoplasma sp. 3341]|uniref:hypothetical protein n=1 Tax=Mycoplasma sp. 3341 TaxID=3447506 RepID=UPI003F659999